MEPVKGTKYEPPQAPTGSYFPTAEPPEMSEIIFI
jgi:hypothetical protein